MASNNCLNLSGTNPVIARYRDNSGQVVIASADQDITFNTDDVTDTHVTKQPDNSTFLINSNGVYIINYNVRINNTGTATNSQFMNGGININGTRAVTGAGAVDIGSPVTGTVAYFSSRNITTVRSLSAGDALTFAVFQSNTGAVTRPLVSDLTYNVIEIIKIGV